jgi:hypothetical protein
MKLSAVLLILLSSFGHAQELRDEATRPQKPVQGRSESLKPKSEPVDFTEWKEELFKNTGLIEGFYKLNKSSKTCQFGELQVKNVGNSASLMFSDHAVLIQMPWGSGIPVKSEADEDGCTRSYQYAYSKGLIHGVQTILCKESKEAEHYDLDLKIVGKALIFSVQDHDHPDIKGTVCRLNLSAHSP